MSPYFKSPPSPVPLFFTPSKVQCCNCDGDMTPNHQCGVPTPVVPDPESVVEEHPPPLPLWHYCCHLGSGDKPVHYYQQCLCMDKVCSCQCYCNEEQLKHRKLFFPDSFSGLTVPVDPKDRPEAKLVAEKRIGQWPIFPCESEDCARPPWHFWTNVNVKFCFLCIPSSLQWRFNSVFLFHVSQVFCAANTRLLLS